MQRTLENAEDEIDHTSAKACTPFPESTEGGVDFCGFENMYEKVLEIEDQLRCPEVQPHVGDEYSELKNCFEQFQRKLPQVIAEAKRKISSAMHQLAIHDTFEK